MLNYVFYCLFCSLFRDICIETEYVTHLLISKFESEKIGHKFSVFTAHFIHRPLVWVKVLLEPDYKSWKLKFPCILRLQPSIFYDESISLRNVIEQLLNMSPNSFSSSTRDDSLELLSLFFKNSLQVRSLHSVFNL